MRKLILLLLFICIIFTPLACADSTSTYNIRPTSGFNDLYVLNPTAEQRTMYPTDATNISALQYNRYVTGRSNHITEVFIEFNELDKGESTFPITFHDGNNTDTLFLHTDVYTDSYLIVLEREYISYSLTDDNGTEVLEPHVCPANKLRILLDDDGLSIGRSTKHSINAHTNDTLVPLQGIQFDLTDIALKPKDADKGIYDVAFAKISYENTEKYDQLEGGLKYIYKPISFVDSDRTIYTLFFYVQKSIAYALFIVSFFLNSFWLYVILAQSAALGYGILQKRKGIQAMIEGYIFVLKEAILLPLNIAKYFFRVIMRIAEIVSNLIPFT